MTDPAPLVSLQSIEVRRPGALILRDATMRLDAGDAIRLIGANGSGKSTLLRVIATLLPPTAGQGTVLGAPLASPTVASVRPQIGLIGHETGLRRGLTLRENLALVSQLAGEGHPDEALARVGLSGAADRRVEHCSNGMLRRADLARLFARPPQLLLLDETHVGLDADAVTLVDELITLVTAAGGGAVVVAHGDTAVPTARRSLRLVDGAIKETT